MKPPYWLYLETPLEKKYLLMLVEWDYLQRLMNNQEIHQEQAKKILERLKSM